jgi:hypothetical protein
VPITDPVVPATWLLLMLLLLAVLLFTGLLTASSLGESG